MLFSAEVVRKLKFPNNSNVPTVEASSDDDTDEIPPSRAAAGPRLNHTRLRNYVLERYYDTKGGRLIRNAKMRVGLQDPISEADTSFDGYCETGGEEVFIVIQSESNLGAPFVDKLYGRGTRRPAYYGRADQAPEAGHLDGGIAARYDNDMESIIVCKPSAFKHGVTEAGIRHAFETVRADVPDEDDLDKRQKERG